MKFKQLTIKNFRNFKNIELNLDNKNIIFGLNDIGKTNFLQAIRFLLDRNIRKNGFVDTDFFNKLTDQMIEIILEINIKDNDNEDNKKIRSIMKGAISSNSDSVFFKLQAKYDEKKLIGNAELFWGYNRNDLEEVPSRQAFYDIDKLFNVVYINSSINLEYVFKRYTKELFQSKQNISDEEKAKLEGHIEKLNKSISELSSMNELKIKLKSEYSKYREEKDLNLEIYSEIELSNVHNKLMPYILNDKKAYPTSGDGRKKILAYSLLTLENSNFEDKQINIFLVEELENHLHRSMELAISSRLFSDSIFKHLFLTTHSSVLISKMDDVNLIKLYRENIIKGQSTIYSISSEYKNFKEKLNKSLSEAIYSDCVLLVEGPSEKTLFEYILRKKCPNYESKGGYILEVSGINFKEYYKVLSELNIKVIMKTDNDLKKPKGKNEYNFLGINRCFSVLGEDRNKKPNHTINISEYTKNEDSYKKKWQEYIYINYQQDIIRFNNNGIYLSKIDLENDLYEVIPDKMEELKGDSLKTAIDYLQSAKLINMIDLCEKLDDDDTSIDNIYNHSHFKCLKDLVDYVDKR